MSDEIISGGKKLNQTLIGIFSLIFAFLSSTSTWREKHSPTARLLKAKTSLLCSSPISSTNLPSQQAPPHVLDVQQSAVVAAISSYSLSTTPSASTFKAFGCTCLKSHHAHEQNCPASTVIKPALTSPTLVCRPPPSHRSLAQRAAVASQIRSNRTISMTPIKEQGQLLAPPSLLLPLAISTGKATELTPILSQQPPSTNPPLPK